MRNTLGRLHSALARALAALMVLVAWSTTASAQIMTPPIELPGEEPRTNWVNASFAHVFKAGIDDMSNTRLQRESALLLMGTKLGEPESKFKLALQFSYQLSAYNFYNDNLNNLGNQGLLHSPPTNLQCGVAGGGCGGSLWSDIHQFTFLGLGTYEIDSAWTLLGGGLFRLSGESGADFSEAVTAGGFGGFLYQATDDLSVGLLIGALSQIEDNAAIVPLPLVNWKIAEAWRFALGPNYLGGAGYGPKVAWVPSKEFDLSLIWSYERRRYRLDNANGSTKNFVGDETSAPLVLQAAWKPDPTVQLGAFVGVVTAGTIRMEDQNGHRVFNKNYNITPTVGANLVYRF